MKKTIIALTFASLLLNSAFAANGIYGSYNKDTKTVTVSGNIENYPNSSVIVTVLKSGKQDLSGITKDNANEYILHYEQCVTNENGEFNISYKTESDGVFKVIANTGDKTKYAEGILSYGEGYLKAVIKDRIEPLRDAENKNNDLAQRIAKLREILKEEGVSEVLGLYKEKLPGNVEAYNASDKALEIFLSQKEEYPVSAKEFQAVFAGAMLTDVFNNAGVDEIYNCIKEYRAYFPEKYSKIIDEYEKLAGENDSLLSVINERLCNEEFSSGENIAYKICEAYAVESVNAMENYTQFSAFVQTLGKEIGFDMDKYNSITAPKDKTNVDKAVIKNKASAADLSSLIKLFSDKCDDEINRVIDSGNTSSGSGGSSSGKGGGRGNMTVPITSPDTLKNESSDFKDLEKSHWAYDYIKQLADCKIMSGYGDNTVKPEGLIKREEFVKLIVSAFDGETLAADVNFDDVAKNDWSFKYIAFAAKKGYVRGISENLFGYGSYITREDCATVIKNVCASNGITLEPIREYPGFADAGEISSYAADSIELLYRAGVIDGTGENFEPKDNVTRAQTAKIICGILKIRKG